MPEIPNTIYYDQHQGTFDIPDKAEIQLSELINKRIVMPGLPPALVKCPHTPLNPDALSIHHIDYSTIEGIHMADELDNNMDRPDTILEESTRRELSDELVQWWVHRLAQNRNAMTRLEETAGESMLSVEEATGLLRLSCGIGTPQQAALLLHRVPEMGGVEVATSHHRPFFSDAANAATQLAINRIKKTESVIFRSEIFDTTRPYNYSVEGQTNRVIIVKSQLGYVSLGASKLDIIQRDEYIALMDGEVVPRMKAIPTADGPKNLATIARSIYLRPSKS